MASQLQGYQLSPQQRRLFLLQELAVQHCAQCIVQLDGMLNLIMLEQAFRKVVERHDILRTNYKSIPGMKFPIQVVSAYLQPVWNSIDVSQQSISEQATTIAQIAQQERELPCDLEHGSPVRLTLCKLAPSQHQLIITLPALCADSGALDNVIKEVANCYRHIETGETGDELEELIQYSQFSEWQHALLEEDQAEIGKMFWQQQYAHAAAIQLSDTVNTSAVDRVLYGSLAQSVKPEILTKIRDLAQAQQVQEETILLVCWQILFWRLTQCNNVLVGTLFDGRKYEELCNGIGLYAKYLPLCSNFSEQGRFNAILDEIDSLLREADELQEFISSDSVDGVEGARPDFLLGFEARTHEQPINSMDMSFTILKHFVYSESFAIKLTCAQYQQDALTLEIHYNQNLFSCDYIQRLLERFLVLLQDALDRPQQLISHLYLISDSERDYLLRDFNATAEPYPAHLCLHQLFEEQVARTPEAIAVQLDEQRMTYRELNARANQIAHYLQRQGVGPDVLVAISLEHNLNLIAALLGVLKAGGAYVPLDPAIPRERLVTLLQQVQPTMLLTQQSLAMMLPESETAYVCLDTQCAVFSQESTENTVSSVCPQHLAYIIFTSGSTGLPKGVMIAHQGLVNYLSWCVKTYPLTEGNGTLLHSSIGVDLTVTSLFASLLVGQKVQMLANDQKIDALREALGSGEGYSLVKLTPAHLEVLNRLLSQEELAASTRSLVIGGEALYDKTLELWKRYAPATRLFNEYGPTEAVVGCGIYEASARTPSSEIIPIGRPIANAHIYVLDAQMQLVPAGAVGEIYIGGDCLARGYFNSPDLTAASFVPHPFSDCPGARLYKTGDLARLNADRHLEFLGRLDSQIKLRGMRIELGEIEAVLLQHPGVRECVVAAKEDVLGDKRLVAFVVAVQGEEAVRLTASALRIFLQAKLPESMVPSFFHMLSSLPLTPSGKADRRTLSLLPLPEEDHSESSVIVYSPIVDIVITAWKEVLGRERVGIHDNFFAQGGHSLLATQLVARLRTILGIDVPLRCLFDAPTIAGLSAQVEQMLRLERGLELPPLQPFSREQDFPLSFAQQRLWFLDQLEPHSAAYNIPHAARLSGRLDRAAFERSLRELLQRHESLRTTFQVKAGQPVQVVTSAEAFSFPVVDLTLLCLEQCQMEISRLALQEAHQPFNLATGPLLRVRLVRMSEDEHTLLLTMHHIVSDDWSMKVFMYEVTTLYNAFTAGQSPSLPALPVQYADFALWQRNWLQGEVLERHLAYWRTQLVGAAPLELPTDYPRPPVQTFEGASQALELPASLHQDLMALSRQEGVTLFMTLLAAFQVLLSRYSGQQDISVGTPIANRTHSELEGLIGFFINTLVIRSDLSANPTFREVLSRVREVALEAYAHQDVPFEKLVEVLEPERNLSRSPLFQVMFILQNEPDATLSFHGLTLHGHEHTSVTSKFDLTFTVQKRSNGLLCHIEYSTDLFTHASMQRFLQHWRVLLEGIVAQPLQRLADLPLLSAEEQQHLLSEGTGPLRPLPAGMTVHEAIEAQAQRTPDALALVCGEQAISYRMLDAQASALAGQLQRHGVQPETLVAVLAERGLALVISVLAIWKAGGAFLPLDPQQPAKRWQQVMQQSAASLVLSSPTLLPSLRQAYQQSAAESPQLLVLPHLLAQGAPEGEPYRRWHWHGHQLAYVISTSGSTGQPKGVMVEQAGMCNHMLGKLADIGFVAGEHLAQTGPQSFDIFLWQALAPLLMGGRVEIFPDEVALQPSSLLQQLQERAISHVQLVPAFLRALVQQVSQFLQEGQEPPTLRDLRWVIPTGDALPSQVARDWWQYYPQIPLLNSYGSTECSDDQCHYALYGPEQLAQQGAIVALGSPIANLRSYVLDRAWRLLPVGAVGELALGGVGVGRGYVGDPVRTAQVFVPDPYGSEPGGRLYLTGDRVRRGADGSVQFLGRGDGLVKLRGYRIELGEIEAVLRQHERVQEAVVVLSEEEGEAGELVAYVVGSEPGEELVTQLSRYLRERLPEYQIPSGWVQLERLPLSSHGKIDRRRLPRPQRAGGQRQQERGIASPLEEVLRTIWQQVLGREQIGVRDNFFALGGHSLLATQLVSRIRALLQVELPLRSLFEAPTIAQQARQIERQRRQQQGGALPPELVARERPEEVPLSFAQQRLWFLEQLEPGNIAYTLYGGVRLYGALLVPALIRSLEEIVRRHESLRTTFEERRKRVVQVFHASGTFELRHYDVSSLPAEERESEVEYVTQQEVKRPFDLARGPLFRALLFRLSDEEHVLLLTTHHIISDGWSVQVLIRELGTLYQAYVAGEPSPLAPLAFQYADFALWQRAWLKDEVLDALSNYWRKQLRGAAPLELPTDRPRQGTTSNQGAIYSFVVPAQVAEALQALSREEGVTLFMTLLTTFQVLLHRHSGQQDIVVGTDIANRTYVELEEIIGFFVNLLVVRTRLTAQDTFRDVLKQVRMVLLDAYAHQDLPFEKLIEVLQLDRAGQQTPLVNTLFVMQNTQPAELVFEGVTITALPVENHTAKFDLAVFMYEGEQGLCGGVNYRSDLFDASSIERLCNRFLVLLQNVVAAPDVPIKNLEIDTEEEKARWADKEILRQEAGRRKLKAARRSAIELTRSGTSEAD